MPLMFSITIFCKIASFLSLRRGRGFIRPKVAELAISIAEKRKFIGEKF